MAGLLVARPDEKDALSRVGILLTDSTTSSTVGLHAEDTAFKIGPISHQAWDASKSRWEYKSKVQLASFSPDVSSLLRPCVSDVSRQNLSFGSKLRGGPTVGRSDKPPCII